MHKEFAWSLCNLPGAHSPGKVNCALAQIDGFGMGKICAKCRNFLLDFWTRRVYNKPRHRFLGARRLYHTAADLSTPNFSIFCTKKIRGATSDLEGGDPFAPVMRELNPLLLRCATITPITGLNLNNPLTNASNKLGSTNRRF